MLWCVFRMVLWCSARHRWRLTSRVRVRVLRALCTEFGKLLPVEERVLFSPVGYEMSQDGNEWVRMSLLGAAVQCIAVHVPMRIR